RTCIRYRICIESNGYAIGARCTRIVGDRPEKSVGLSCRATEAALRIVDIIDNTKSVRITCRCKTPLTSSYRWRVTLQGGARSANGSIRTGIGGSRCIYIKNYFDNVGAWSA